MKTLSKVVFIGLGLMGIAGAAQAGTSCASCELAPTINSNQIQDHATLSAVQKITVKDVSGGLTGSSTAVGNNLSADVGDKTLGNINTTQNFGSYGGNVSATLNATSGNVAGSVDLSATAVANNVSITAGQTGNIYNVQNAFYDPSATLNANLGDVSGTLTTSTTAVANNMSVQAFFPTLSNTQISNWQPINANSTVVAGNVANVTVSATAVGNNLSIKGW